VKIKMGLLREARSTFDLVAKDVVDPPDDWGALDEFERDIININILLRTYENDVDPSFAKFFEAVEHMAGADALTRGVLDCSGAVAIMNFGEFQKAEDFARRAMTSMRAANSVLGLNYCFLHAGLSCAYRGELRSAVAYLQRASDMAIENFGADSGLKALAETLLNFAQLWSCGGNSMTSQGLDEAFRHICEYDGWFEIYAAGLDSRFRLAWLDKDIAAMDSVIADGQALTQSRDLNRLCAIVDAQRLLRHMAADETARAGALADMLAKRFPKGIWARVPTHWRHYLDVAFAQGTWFASRNPRHARAYAEDGLACARSLAARPYEVRGLVLLAHIAMSARRANEAMSHLRLAVERAAEEKISLPFLEYPSLAPLIRKLKRDLWDGGGNVVEASFLSEIDDRIAEAVPFDNTPMAMLSNREQEIVIELSRGLTNKEIARALDMTENTVKFHLKNIFAKLGVDRRAHALMAVRDSDWTDRDPAT